MIFRKILIPLILLGILLAATIYWKQEDSAGRGNPAGTFLHYSAGSKSRPAHTDSKPGPKTEMLKAENAQLRKQHQAMSAQLARTQSQLKRLQKAKQAQQDIRSQPETQQILSTMDLEVTRQDNHLVIYDKQGQELFGFDLENKRLSYEGGMHLFPLKTVIFDVPESVRDLKSIEGKERATLTFENTREDDVHIFWMDYKGQPKHYRTLNPGMKHTQETFVTHPWIFADSKGIIHSQVEPILIDQNESITIPE